MKLIVFGATGSVGIQIVKQALEQGHSVTAFTRSPEKLAGVSQQNLYIFKGDILNLQDVDNAIENHDCVLCSIGDGKIGKVRAIGTQNIIEAMKKANIKKLICQTTLGLRDSYGNLNFIWKHIMFGFLLKKSFQDHQLQEQYLFSCNLNYIIIRPSAFTEGAITNNYKFGFDGNYKNLSLKISRADVADFMIQQVISNQYFKKAVSISN